MSHYEELQHPNNMKSDVKTTNSDEVEKDCSYYFFKMD
jgi:hypothetical protein